MKRSTDEAALARALPEDKEIRAEYRRLMKLYEAAPQNRLALARKLISRAAFLAVTLDRMERDIAENGWEDEYQNGANQSGKKESSAAKLHVSMTKNFTSVMARLDDMLEAPDEGGGDEFEDF